MRKKIIIAILFFVLLLSVHGCSSTTSEEQPLNEHSVYQVYFDIDFEDNLLFSRYDVDVFVDDNKIGTIPHGAAFTHLSNLEEGKHSVFFYKLDDTSVRAKKEINVAEDTTYIFLIHSNNGSIEIKNFETMSGISGNNLAMLNVIGLNFEEAKTQLLNAGFVNVNYKTTKNDFIWDESAWVVVSQNIESGEIIDKNQEIILVCDRPQDDSSETKSAVSSDYDLDKDLTVVQCERDASKKTMYHVAFEERDSSGNAIREYSFDSIINPRTMGDQFNAIGDLPSWFYVGATVHVQANLSNGSLSQVNCIVTEATNITQLTSEQESQSIPIMSGATLDAVIEVGNEYGLSRVYDDIDFGHGTRCCSLESQNGGLTLDIIYLTETQELLSGSIVTFNNLSSSKEQRDFIAAMAGVLCPSADKKEVTDWVNANVGTSDKTTINGFVYEVALGPSGNCIYNAGDENWEAWDQSLS